jgi:hypothetical protein
MNAANAGQPVRAGDCATVWLARFPPDVGWQGRDRAGIRAGITAVAGLAV